MQKKKVVIGFLGTQLDAGFSYKRWHKWRPTVSLVMHDDFDVGRIELFSAERYQEQANKIEQDIVETSPHTIINLVPMELQDPWDFEEVYSALFDWANHYPFDPVNEEYFVHITTGTHVAQICMFLLIESHLIPGKLLQSSPTSRKESPEKGQLHWIDLDLSRYDKIAERFQVETSNALNFLKSGIQTRNPKFNQTIAEIERVAIHSTAPVLIVGPTGAGKSFLARKIFELKKSRHQITGEFVEVNCATLRGDSAMSTLFGHKKGAFTGAVDHRAGLLKTADHGVLFLDEIGELGLDEQAMLLKAIEEKKFLPVGADREINSNFQLIAGTNRDLREEVMLGNFREDLFARINLWTYPLPGLCDRPEDIEPSLDYLLTLSAKDNGHTTRFNKEAKARFLSFATSKNALWRGNFRDLTATVTRMTTLAQNGRITLELVEAEIVRLEWLWHKHLQQPKSTDHSQALIDIIGQEAFDALDLFDQLQLSSIISICQASKNMAEAGRKLFDQTRLQKTNHNDSDRLRKYLQKFGIGWGDIVR